jgi:hypothetical protein
MNNTEQDFRRKNLNLFYPKFRYGTNYDLGQLSRYSDELRARRPGFDSWPGQGFSLLDRIQTGSGAHPAPYPMGTGGAISSGVKRLCREADHSPPTSAELKNTEIYTSTPPYAFMAWCLIKHSDDFTFY